MPIGGGSALIMGHKKSATGASSVARLRPTPCCCTCDGPAAPARVRPSDLVAGERFITRASRKVLASRKRRPPPIKPNSPELDFAATDREDMMAPGGCRLEVDRQTRAWPEILHRNSV